MSEIPKQIDALLESARQEGYASGYADARRAYTLKAADEINKIVGEAYRSHKDILQKWANELGRTIHTAIPGQDVAPYKNSDTP